MEGERWPAVVVTAVALAAPVGLLLLRGILGFGPVANTGGAIASATPEVAYDPTRLTIGLALAGSFLALAWWLIRTTDWSRPDDGASE